MDAPLTGPGSSPSADQRDRFRAATGRLGGAPSQSAPLALAVSGGPDSMAMLLLGAATFPGAVIAATVDHRLRTESAGEAAMVADWCRAAAVPHQVLTLTAERPATGNLHAWARMQRYALLLDWASAQGSPALCSAHHADDQAETFLMRANRGAGIAGLAGIRERVAVPDGLWPGSGDAAPSTAIIRPLLSWRRAELRALAQAAELPFVDDPSNADDRFERARIRAALADQRWADIASIAEAARHAADADEALTAMTLTLWVERLDPASSAADIRLGMRGLPGELRRRLARLAIDRVAAAANLPSPARARESIEPLLAALGAGGGATHGGVMASARGEIWRFRPAPPRR